MRCKAEIESRAKVKKDELCNNKVQLEMCAILYKMMKTLKLRYDISNSILCR